jgi:hypothetical protein
MAPRFGMVAIGLAAACLAASACSPGADSPSPFLPFPAVHDMPPPRSDPTLDADQVQKATNDLIDERNHLSAEAQSSPSNPDKAPTVAPKQSAKAQNQTPQGGQSSANAATQTAGADAKP